MAAPALKSSSNTWCVPVTARNSKIWSSCTHRAIRTCPACTGAPIRKNVRFSRQRLSPSSSRHKSASELDAEEDNDKKFAIFLGGEGLKKVAAIGSLLPGIEACGQKLHRPEDELPDREDAESGSGFLEAFANRAAVKAVALLPRWCAYLEVLKNQSPPTERSVTRA